MPVKKTFIYVANACLSALVTIALSAQQAIPSEPASPIDTIYIIASSHWDFGFIRTPEDEQAEMKPHLDAVLAACKRDSSFRWTIESVWQLGAWLERTKDEAKVSEMRERIASGQIQVSASWGSMHTEFLGTEELNRLEDEGRRLARRIPFQGDMAMEDDVPGFSLRLPQVLAKSGVRYLVNGSNAFIGGGTSLSPRFAPFYWASPDGSRVLTWTTRSAEGGYTEGLANYYLDPQALDPYLHTPFYPKEWKGLPDDEIMSRGVQKLLAHYGDAGYAGHSIAVLYMHDGIGPEFEESLLKRVKRWNEQGHLPRLQLATPEEYFRSFTPEELASLPTYRGDWSGLWAEAKTSSPGMSADARYIQEALPMADEVAALSALEGIPLSVGSGLHTAEIDLMRFDEHNGAGNAGWPKVLTESEINRSNEQYAGYLRDARLKVDAVLRKGFTTLAKTKPERSSKQFLVVTNLRSWSRSGPVQVDVEPGDFILRDATSGQKVPTERSASGTLLFTARDVPANGYKTYTLEKNSDPEAKNAVDGSGHIENDRYAIDVDVVTGNVLRIVDRRSGQNLFSAGALTVLRSGKPANAPAGVIVQRQRGAVADEITINRAGSWWARTVLSLPHGLDEVRMEQVLDREQMPAVQFSQPSDRYTISFPFAAGSEAAEWVDDGIGFHRVPQELLPGARTNGVVPRFVVALARDDQAARSHLLFAQRESFFLSTSKIPGDFEVLALEKSEQGDTKDHGVVTFKTFEPGYPTEYAFHFRLRSQAGLFDPVEAYRFGREDIVPLEGSLLPPNRRPIALEKTMLRVSARNVAVDDLRSIADVCAGCYLLRLQEIAGLQTTVSLRVAGQTFTAARTDMTGMDEQQPINLGSISLGAHETLTLRLRKLP